MPQLISVLSVRETATEGELEMTITVDAGNGEETWGYTYDPADPIGLTSQVASWLEANPGTTIEPYEPPPGPSLLDQPLTRRQVRAALALAGFPRTAVPDAIELIPDPTQRDLAMIDWEDAPFYNRSHPLFNDASLLAVLGLNGAMIDAMWVSAHGLPA